MIPDIVCHRNVCYFQSYQSELTKLKHRIIRYLGQLGGALNTALLANSDDDIAQRAVTWDTELHLKFDMPFKDMKPTIYLGERIL